MAGILAPRKHIRRSTGLLVWAVLLLCAQLASALSFYEPGPQGPVGISRPTISQQFNLLPGESIVRARLWLNGTQVQAKWSLDGLVSYTPPEPLAPGVYTARLSVEITTGSSGSFYAPIVREFSFTVRPGALASLPAPRSEEVRAAEYLNRLRAAAGLPPLALSEALGAVAAAHAAYLAVNPSQRVIDAHRQAPGTPLFFGATAGERAAYYGYVSNLSEVINFVDRAEDAIDGWMDTLYHRIPLIHPGMTQVGYGLAGQGEDLVNVMITGPALESTLRVRWPYAGQQGVPTNWSGAEVPDPFVLYPNAERPVGYPITLTFGERVKRLTLVTARLNGPRGDVPVMLFHPGNDPLLTDTVAMIPRAPLIPGSIYSVRLEGTVDLGQGPQPYTELWSFGTAAFDRPILRTRITTASSVDGTLRSIAVEGTGFGPKIRVFLGGLPVENLRVESAARISFEAPTGFFGGAADLLVVLPDGSEVIWTNFLAGDEPLRFPGRVLPFTDLPVTVHGRSVESPSMLHRNGTVLLPVQVLEMIGAQVDHISHIGRSYWRLAGRSADYIMGRTASQLGSQPMTLALPVQSRLGTPYFDASLVAFLTQNPVSVVSGQVHVGMRDIGQHWARPEILALLQSGIVSGTGDGRYDPEGRLTRAAFLKMLVGARNLGVTPGDAGGFVDTRTHWVTAQGYIGTALAAGIILPGDYQDGRFEPDRDISREEMAVMVTRTLGLEDQVNERVFSPQVDVITVGDRQFRDANTWTRAGHIVVAIEQGIITGYLETDGRFTFRPGRNATRAEAAVMVIRAMEYAQRAGE